MNCPCGSDRILALNGKSSDLNDVSFRSPGFDIHVEKQGYLPEIANVCAGDYFHVNICVTCHRVVGFPRMSDAEIVKALT